MSTEFQIIPDPAVEKRDEPIMEISENSGRFMISVIGRVYETGRVHRAVVDLPVDLTPDDLIGMALRLIQPAFYNLADPAAARDWIIDALKKMAY